MSTSSPLATVDVPAQPPRSLTPEPDQGATSLLDRVRAARNGSWDGVAPFPGERLPRPPLVQLVVTLVLVGTPFVGLGIGIGLLWGHGISWTDVWLGVVLYLVSGFGVTVGFHRLLTHGSFVAAPLLRRVLAVAGSLAFEGGVIAWVAAHRRHHAFSDRPGDPHSPYKYGTSPLGVVRGLAHAHVGWLFGNDPTPSPRYAPDLLSDRFMRVIDRGFPVMCLISLAVPFFAGWALVHTINGALLALLWAGLVRVCVLHHATWSVNSLCHLLGRRPFRTREYDRATNLWPLALLTFGESWHNFHHADPTSARHGAGRGQIDPSAGLIRLFERAGWATAVRWPSATRVGDQRV